jgi:hypothetical protein
MDKSDAEVLAGCLVEVRAEQPDDNYWEVAADRAGVPTRLLRVIREAPAPAFLLDEAWVIDLQRDDPVRLWEGEDDPLYDLAESFDAFEDLD